MHSQLVWLLRANPNREASARHSVWTGCPSIAKKEDVVAPKSTSPGGKGDDSVRDQEPHLSDKFLTQGDYQ